MAQCLGCNNACSVGLTSADATHETFRGYCTAVPHVISVTEECQTLRIWLNIP